MAFYVDNAISWAIMRMRGGWKNLLTISITYALIAAFSITLFYQLMEQPRDKKNVLFMSSVMTLIVQVLLLVVLGGAQISNLIRRDITSRQIESNRLMPLSPIQGIVGYIFGGTLQILALSAVNLVIGTILGLMRGIPADDWLIANVILFLFCFSIWSATAMAGFVSRVMFGALLGLCCCIGFSGGFVFVIAPGLLAFCTPMQDRTIFQTISHSRLTTGSIVGGGAQLLISLLCIRGAARKYASDSAQTVPIGPAMAMLGIWSGLTWFGMTDFTYIRPSLIVGATIDWRVIVVGAVATCMLAALLPVASIAWSNIMRQQHRLAGENVSIRGWLFWIWLLPCVLFAVVPLSANLNEELLTGNGWYNTTSGVNLPVLAFGRHPNAFMICCACAIFLIQTYFLMRLLYPRIKRANFLLALIVVLTWFLPLMTDLIYYGLHDSPQPHVDRVGLLSPIGTIIQAIDNPARMTWNGVIAQGLIALIPIILFLIGMVRAQSRPSRGFPIEPLLVSAGISGPESANPAAN